MNRHHLLALLLSSSLCSAAAAQGGSSGPQLLQQFDYGFAVADAGDVDGDGTPDVITGYSGYSSVFQGMTNNGAAFVWSGATGAQLYAFYGGATSDNLGWTVTGAGDLNADGVPDLAVAAPNADPFGRLNAGTVSAYSGADGSLLWQAHGQSANGMFGQALAAAGDVNADGYDDLLIGDPQDSFWGGGAGAGAAGVYSGATGTALWIYVGAPADAMGWSVAAAGDHDGDGYADVLVGAPGADVGSFRNAGSVYLYSGAAHAVLLQLDGLQDGGFGKSIAAGADVDGDGSPDILAGADVVHTASSGGQSTGAAYLYSNGGALLRQHDGLGDLDLFGGSAALVGDLNGDGASEYLIGAPGADAGGFTLNGTVSLHDGAGGGLLHRFEGGSHFRQLGQVVAAGSDLDGDGVAEFLISDPGNWAGGFHGSGDAWSWVVDPFLTATADQVSAAAGGSVDFQLDFPASEAGASYVLAGSATGTGPTSLNGVEVPLTQDWFTSLMTSGSPPGVFSNSAGVLDPSGDALASLILPPNGAAAYVGSTFWFAAVSFLPPGAVQLSSVAVSVSVQP